jgi:nucleotide-binding universal stress UspA family protein
MGITEEFTMKILLAVDGSDCSTRAARQVVTLARALRKRPTVVLINVDAPLMSSVAVRIGAQETARMHSENADAALKDARAILRRAGIAHREEMIVGDAGPAIARFAGTSKSDLIVMGSHGRTAIASLVMGSVANKVIALGAAPVLVVR